MRRRGCITGVLPEDTFRTSGKSRMRLRLRHVQWSLERTDLKLGGKVTLITGI
jgi:hypothetical protein